MWNEEEDPQDTRPALRGRASEEKRMPHGKWEMAVVTFTSVHTDMVIPHKLDPVDPNSVKFEVMDRNAPGSVYRGAKSPASNYIVLRATVVGEFHIRLYIPAHFSAARLRTTSYVPPVVMPVPTGDTGNFLRADNSWAIAFAHVIQGRLTLESGVPVSSTDQTGKTNVYFTPVGGNRIALFDSTYWKLYPFAQITGALGTLVNAQAYDVFIYDNVGTLTMEFAEWANATVTMTIASPGVVTWTAHGMATKNSITFTTSGALPTGVVANTQYWITVVDANTFKLSTTLALCEAGTFINTSGSQSGVHTGHQPQARATALVTQDGVLVKSGSVTRRYVGMFMTTSTTTTEDSEANRLLWNYYNRVTRVIRKFEATASWASVGSVFRQLNGAAANKVAFVTGFAEEVLDVTAMLTAFSSVNSIHAVAIGESSTTTASPNALGNSNQEWNNGYVGSISRLTKVPAIGYTVWTCLESLSSAGTVVGVTINTTTNIQSGLTGQIRN